MRKATWPSVIVNRDISERKRAEQQLEYNLFHDLLTGLPNRRMFMDRLPTAFARKGRETGRSYALLLTNVDHFKVLNQAMGTKAGDPILPEIARCLSAEMRRDDAAARNRTAASDASPFRLGADEFIETVRQLERLLELGCEYGQGYFFSQPMQAKAA